jgi:hypothetical protein
MAVMRDPDPGDDGRFWIAMLLVPLVWLAGIYPIARLGQNLSESARSACLIFVLLACTAGEIALARYIVSVSSYGGGS